MPLGPPTALLDETTTLVLFVRVAPPPLQIPPPWPAPPAPPRPPLPPVAVPPVPPEAPGLPGAPTPAPPAAAWPPAPPAALLPVNVLAAPVREALPRLNSPPPWPAPPAPPAPPVPVALVALPPAPPAPPTARSEENVVPLTVSAAPAALKTPPPSPAPPGPPAVPVSMPPAAPAAPAPPIASFDAIVVFTRLSDPAALKIPPPSPAPPAPPGPEPGAPSATLFVTTTELSESRPPLFKIPPPAPTTRPCWIVTPVIDTVPLCTWMTRSRLLPSMIVLPAPLPWIETLAVMSRSPVAPLSAPVGASVSVNVPAGRTILLEPPCASAAWMAERNETCPLESLPVFKLTASVSSSVLTWNVLGVTRCSSHSRLGRERIVLRLPSPLRDLSKLPIGFSP